MRHDSLHVSDERLLRFADGELDKHEAVEIQAHLDSCWGCRSRRRALEDAIAGFVDAWERESEDQFPPADGPKALLRARLSELAVSTHHPARLHRSSFRLATGLAGLVAAGLLIAAGWSAFVPAVGPDRDQPIPSPDSGLTPGAAVLYSTEDVCRGMPSIEPPAVSRTMAMAIFRTYGIDDPRPGAYELDYLVSPEIGGAADVHNLWPQSYSGIWNAHVKDALEDHLRDLICSGGIDLETAQREIATDWIAAYRKYFDTNEPVAAHVGFRKDRPWQ